MLTYEDGQDSGEYPKKNYKILAAECGEREYKIQWGNVGRVIEI
jgi:hypothetical protein